MKSKLGTQASFVQDMFHLCTSKVGASEDELNFPPSSSLHNQEPRPERVSFSSLVKNPLNLSVFGVAPKVPFDTPLIPAIYTHLALKQSLSDTSKSKNYLSAVLSKQEADLHKRYETKIGQLQLRKSTLKNKMLKLLQPFQAEIQNEQQNLINLKLDERTQADEFLEEPIDYDLSSVLKKRRKKMNHHKHRKRLKKNRVLRKKLGKI